MNGLKKWPWQVAMVILLSLQAMLVAWDSDFARIILAGVTVAVLQIGQRFTESKAFLNASSDQ